MKSVKLEIYAIQPTLHGLLMVALIVLINHPAILYVLASFKIAFRLVRLQVQLYEHVTSQIQFGDVFQLQNSLVLLRFWLSEVRDKTGRATPLYFIVINCFLSRVNLFLLCLDVTALRVSIVCLVFIKQVRRQDTNQTRSLRLSRQHLRIMP